MIDEYGTKVSFINVMRSYTYEVDFIADRLRENNNGDEPTIDDVLNRIAELAQEEFNSPPRRGELIFTDEHGNNY